MAVKTWDTSRTGGGTYELEKDSSGNYQLKSVGFAQVNKLNLPDLKTSDATTTTTDTSKTEEKKTEVADPYKKLFKQTEGGDNKDLQISQNYERIIPREAKVKEATVSELGQKTNTTYNAMTDAEKNAIATGTSGMSFKGAETSAKNPSIGFGQGQVDPGLAKAAGMPSTIDTTKTYSTPRTIADQKKYLGTTFTPKTTGLQDVVSKGKSAVTNTVSKILNNSATVMVMKGIGNIANAMIDPYQRDLNKANKKGLTTLGYKTNFELGISTDPGRIAGNPANSVFAGMNAQSHFGDITKGAQKRIDTRTKTAARKEGKWSQERLDNFNAKTKEFENQKSEHDAKTARDKANAAAAKDNRAGVGGSCFIAGTKVTMSDGTLKNIENIVVGDKVKGYKEDNTVIKLDPTLLADRKLYSFNNNEHYFFTSEHPFMTKEGWKSVKPEKTKERDGIELYNQLKGELKIGDRLITEDGSIEITEIKSKEINNPDMPLYNFNVSNDNSYVADKYIVHNKGGGSGGRVICTDLHRTGELSTKDWVRDTKFTFKTLSKTHVKGYLLWAEPTVKHMQKYPRYRKIWKHIAQHRANDIAWRLNEGKFDLLGRIYAGIGEPVCWALGNFVSDKQISKYNLTHWRRA